MRVTPNALMILLVEREKGFKSIPADLVKTIYQIEERVQFDEMRSETPQKIRQALKTVLDKESLEGVGNGNAV